MFRLQVDITYIYIFTFKNSFDCGKQTYWDKIYVADSCDIINCLKYIERNKSDIHPNKGIN